MCPDISLFTVLHEIAHTLDSRAQYHLWSTTGVRIIQYVNDDSRFFDTGGPGHGACFREAFNWTVHAYHDREYDSDGPCSVVVDILNGTFEGAARRSPVEAGN